MSGDPINKVPVEDAVEIKPFTLSYDASAGIQDFRPRVVMADPKESVAAPSDEKPKEEQPGVTVIPEVKEPETQKHEEVKTAESDPVLAILSEIKAPTPKNITPSAR